MLDPTWVPHTNVAITSAWLAKSLQQHLRFLAIEGVSASETEQVIHATALSLGSVVRFVRIANPLGSPLTLTRILFQIGGDEAVSDDEEMASIVRVLATKVGSERQIVLIVEHAGTLHRNALYFLQELPTLVPEGAAFVQVVFLVGPQFEMLLDGQEFNSLKTQLVLPAVTKAGSQLNSLNTQLFLATGSRAGAQLNSLKTQLVLPAGTGAGATPKVPDAIMRKSLPKGRMIAALLGLTLVSGFAGAFLYRYYQHSDPLEVQTVLIRRSLMPVSNAGPGPLPDIQPGAIDNASPLAAGPQTLAGTDQAEVSSVSKTFHSAAVSVQASEPPDMRDQLRRKFNAFLSISGPQFARLTEAQRELLFQEYLAQSAKTLVAP
jgi:hypothetical protein